MRVTLVGIGPGNPQLVTLQAQDVLSRADVVRYHDGCDEVILAHAPQTADIARFGSAQEVLARAREGKDVAVLYRGDPYAFGDGAGLAEQMVAAGVELDVVPGVLVEAAAAAMGGIPLSVERRSASIGIGATASGDTRVLRMADGWWEAGIDLLLRSGVPAGASAALLTEAGEATQDRVSAPLEELVGHARARGLRGEAVLIVGAGVDLADRLDVARRRPLQGLRVLVTRARHQAPDFRRQLVRLGASVIEIPTIEIQPLIDSAQCKAALAQLPQTRLIVFASANAVDLFFQLLLQGDRDARDLARCRVCAIGPESARTLESHGLRPDLVAGEYTAEGLAEALEGWDIGGWRVLVPRAQMARDALPQLLARRGAEVEFLPVYRTVSPPGVEEKLQALFAGRGVDIVTFTASSTVTHFVRAFPEEQLEELQRRTKIACIGPVTADTARRLGLRVAITARDYTTRGLVKAIVEARATS
ncbi:MAG: uroporphyrinogen-III synthase [Candidatus Dormibacteraeota bacterium]|nr:uroporphyrinogen-III synthase [Candidatus Dormibacteraeota bacterium]